MQFMKNAFLDQLEASDQLRHDWTDYLKMCMCLPVAFVVKAKKSEYRLES